ncbi:methionine--tRNA ligase [Peijinzhouia sedimentorum]
MAKKFNRTTVTAALPYANGPVHIGHLAGVYIPADIYVRYLRSKGDDVAFICGSDEHGVPITLRAQKEGTTPQAIVDKYHTQIQQSFKEFGIAFDIYSRTSSPTHHDTASGFFKNLNDKNEFIEKESEQFYDESANQFLADRYIMGTCPKCGNPDAYGDQCEKCGTSLSPDELGDPRSMLSGAKPIKKNTKHWYLPLDKYENWLREWILDGHKEWKSNVYGQCKSWIDQGLQPRAVTRDLDWGVPVPVEGSEGKVLYVWFDAPIGYISATREWAEQTGKNWEDYWKKDDTRLLHFIGKDNIVFHCIIFPSMLKAHGDYILPDNVPANEFLNLEGNKISTSRNWAVWLHEYLIDFPDKQDVLRYVLTSNAPETKDNDFTWKDFQARNNNELVAIFGNFVNRAVVLTNKYYEGAIPKPCSFSENDQDLIKAISEFPAKITASLDQFRFREALAVLIDLARTGNKYLAENEPWKLIKSDAERTATIMYLANQVVGNLAILSEPFLPHTAIKLKAMLNQPNLSWNEAGGHEILSVGHRIAEATLLFQKIEDSEIENQIQKLENTKTQNIANNAELTIPAAKEIITFDQFAGMDLRVGTILSAEPVPKSKKLLKLLVDTGLDQRTILSGIAQHFNPEELVGKQVTVLANLAPRPMMGMESQGMVLMAEDLDGKLRLLVPEQKVAAGSTIS